MNTVLFCISVCGFSPAVLAQEQTLPSHLPSAPTLNFYGVPGVIDMPDANMLPNGQIAIGVSSFGGQTRTNFTFQFSPRITVTFRYIGVQDWNSDGFDTYRDRSFDFRYLLFKEGRIAPAISIGLQDLAGTGIYAGEYVVGTKTFERPFRLGRALKVTAGLGWGRLGSAGSIGSPIGVDRPQFVPGDPGGDLSVDQWFRGPVSPFGGLEWQVNDRLSLKAEYSTDAYAAEASRGVFSKRSRFNFGIEYQVNSALRLGGYWLYGSEIGVNLQLQVNPKNPPLPYRLAGPRPIIERPERRSNRAAYDTGWIAAQNASVVIRDALVSELGQDGIRLHSVTVGAIRAETRVSSDRFDNFAILTGRTARAMARILPPSVETFDVVLVTNDIPVSRITLLRRDLETLEFQPDASALLLSRIAVSDADPDPQGLIAQVDGFYPNFRWAVGPYIRPSFFDPDRPVRADLGISVMAQYRFAPGWQIFGEVRHRLVGNIADASRPSDSVLPRVRTDALLYAQATDTALEQLVLSRQWKPGPTVFARVSIGYLEQMFGGVSGELLWKPADSPLAIGIELNYVKQRDFDQGFGFQDYEVATGHLSAYYDFGNGYHAQIDAGRYLAGDVGATVTVERQFANGWRVGGFVTLTDVSAEDFGEGSFDKGITFTVPVSWFAGEPSRRAVSATIRPVQRDGGARLNVSGRLYEQIRSGHLVDVANDWGRVWQ